VGIGLMKGRPAKSRSLQISEPGMPRIIARTALSTRLIYRSNFVTAEGLRAELVTAESVALKAMGTSECAFISILQHKIRFNPPKSAFLRDAYVCSRKMLTYALRLTLYEKWFQALVSPLRMA
jgi:hypothetical protein